MIEIVIPIEKWSEQLNTTIDSIHRTVDNPVLRILEEPDINVAEARELAIKTSKADYICFLDYDSVMIMDGWLDELHSTYMKLPDAGAVFMNEWWGTETNMRTPHHQSGEVIQQVEYGPAACMFIDRRKIPESLIWDKHIGLANGWLGGDAEEVAWQYELRLRTNCNFYRRNDLYFHHQGGKKLLTDFCRTDRFKTCRIMMHLIHMKYLKDPYNADYFKLLQYKKASVYDDCMLASGTIHDCFKGVVHDNNLQWRNFFKRNKLV